MLVQDVSANSLLKTIAQDCSADQKGWLHATRVENRGGGKEVGKKGGKTEWRDE